MGLPRWFLCVCGGGGTDEKKDRTRNGASRRVRGLTISEALIWRSMISWLLVADSSLTRPPRPPTKTPDHIVPWSCAGGQKGVTSGCTLRSPAASTPSGVLSVAQISCSITSLQQPCPGQLVNYLRKYSVLPGIYRIPYCSDVLVIRCLWRFISGRF